MEVSKTVGKLDVEHRTGFGKSAMRKLRQGGKIPGICYGKGEEPIALALDPIELSRALDPEKRANTLITLKVSGAGGDAQELTVMLRDWQKDALRGNVTHADFLRVSLDRDVHATVPILLTGKAEGVKLGGILHQVYRQLEIACTPDKIPTRLEISVDKLGMGDALHVRDIQLPPGVRALLDGGAAICTVTAPKAEKTAEQAAAEAAAAVEGAAAATGAEGAKPAAEGAKAPSAKAPAKEEKGDKKK